ncbi:hypothetical protein [Bartonella jaculi]
MIPSNVANLALKAKDDEALETRELSHYLHKALRRFSALNGVREVMKFP